MRDLRVYYGTLRGTVRAVDRVTLEIGSGEVLGLVGESGCGKSTLGRGILGLLPEGAVSDGEVLYGGRNLVGMSDKELRRFRGPDLGLIFQEPMTRLNPLMRIEQHFAETLKQHEPGLKGDEIRRRSLETLGQMGIPPTRFKQYPHEFSGGMRQRIMIALALVLRPKLLIADEPTTSLDVIVEAQILSILADLRRNFGTALLLITHNLGIVAEACDRVAVMYAGQIVEEGDARDVFSDPAHPVHARAPAFDDLPRYDGAPLDSGGSAEPHHAAHRMPLPSALPRHDARLRLEVPAAGGSRGRPACFLLAAHAGRRRRSDATRARGARGGRRGLSTATADSAMPDAPTADVLVSVRNLKTYYGLRGSFRQRLLGREAGSVRAVDDVTLDIRRGEVLGLVGESGSGKTTLGRTLLGLVPATEGSVRFEGEEITTMSERELRRLRRRMQIVFQDPHASLNPAMTIQQSVGHPLEIHGIAKGAERRSRVAEALETVGLAPAEQFIDKYPSDLSGGQKQRAVIARAIILNPMLLVADEPVSMLDMSVRAKILELMLT